MNDLPDTDMTVPAPGGVDLDEVYASERRSVLVIEDEPDTVVLLKHILRSAGFNVMGALSGNEALK